MVYKARSFNQGQAFIDDLCERGVLWKHNPVKDDKQVLLDLLHAEKVFVISDRVWSRCYKTFLEEVQKM